MDTPYPDELNLQLNATPKTTHSLLECESVTGIVEISDDVFTVAVGYFSLAAEPVKGSKSTWRFAFDEPALDDVKIQKIADSPQATFLKH